MGGVSRSVGVGGGDAGGLASMGAAQRLEAVGDGGGGHALGGGWVGGRDVSGCGHVDSVVGELGAHASGGGLSRSGGWESRSGGKGGDGGEERWVVVVRVVDFVEQAACWERRGASNLRGRGQCPRHFFWGHFFLACDGALFIHINSRVPQV